MNTRGAFARLVRLSFGLLVAAGALSCGSDEMEPPGGAADAAADGARQDARSDAGAAQESGRDATTGERDASAAERDEVAPDAPAEDAVDASGQEGSFGPDAADGGADRDGAELLDRSVQDGPSGAESSTDGDAAQAVEASSAEAAPDVLESGSGDGAMADAASGDEGEASTDAPAAVADAGSEATSDAGLGAAEAGDAAPIDAAPAVLHSCAPAQGAIPQLAAEIIAQGLTEPLGVEASSHDTTRLYIVEKAGKIRLVKNGALLATPFLDLTSIVWHDSEAGLLGVAFHPNYESNGRFWVYHVVNESFGGLLFEYHRSDANPDVADPTPVGGAPIFRALKSHIHQGGALEFSPDGFLYLALGERGTGDWAQDFTSPYAAGGKILRFDVTTYPYTIPPGNMTRGLPEVWDYGLRNPWRASFDLCTGDFYIGDVGERLREEVNIEPAGQGGRNYGWPMTEGTLCHPLGTACDKTGITFSTIEYGHNVMSVVVGGYVYRGSLIPSLRGRYVYGDTGGNIYWLTHSNGLLSTFDTLPVPRLAGTLVSFGQDAAGEIYTAELTSGEVRRIKPQ